MVGNKIEGYINDLNNRNRSFEDFIVTMNSSKKKVDSELEGKTKLITVQALEETARQLENFINVRREIVPTLEETIYWEKEYKRREEEAKNNN